MNKVSTPTSTQLELAQHALRLMMRTRIIESALLDCYKQGFVYGSLLIGQGQEATTIGTALALDRSCDIVHPLIRNLGLFMAWGEPTETLIRHMLGRPNGSTLGYDTTCHHGYWERGIFTMASHLGTGIPLCAGAAMVARDVEAPGGGTAVALAVAGDGCSSVGDVHEGLNFAAVQKLPLILLIENNGYAYTTPTRYQYSVESLAERARGYDIEGRSVDGNNFFAVVDALGELIAGARQGDGPKILECRTFRMSGHAAHDDARYVPDNIRQDWRERDAITRLETWVNEVRGESDWTSALRAEEEALAKAQIEAAIAEPIGDYGAFRPVYHQGDAVVRSFAHEAAGPWLEKGVGEAVPKRVLPHCDLGNVSPYKAPPAFAKPLTVVHAINTALKHEMEANDRVHIVGEDIGSYGGAFKVTAGLLEAFGKKRVVDVPIGEAGLMGFANGLAQMGYPTVAEMQFADFGSNAITQMMQVAGMSYGRSGVPVPVVLRLPNGGNLSVGPFHSQEWESFYTHVPGVKVFYPSSPSSAYYLMRLAIRDPNPVVFFEHKGLYRRGSEVIPSLEKLDFEDITRPRVLKAGNDVTVVSYGLILRSVLEAANLLEAEGCSVEVMVVSCLKPLNLEVVLESVHKTGRFVCVSESWPASSFARSVCYEVSEKCFTSLKCSPKAITSLDRPIPYAKPLESAYRPSVASICDDVRAVAAS